MKKTFLIFVATLLPACLMAGQPDQKYFPVFKGPYLGQKPPGMTPEVFAPVPLQADKTWFWHGSPSFSPVGNEIYFVKYSKGKNVTEIYRMRKEGQIWGAPGIAFFSKAEYRDNNPFFHGPQTLLFYSARFGGSICRIDEINDPGSQPAALALPIPAGKMLGKQFSVTKGSGVYIELWNNDDSDADIYCCNPADGKYAVCERLSGNVNSSAYDFNPFVDPEEKILIFASQRPGGFGKTDIYMSFRNADGTWNRAINLGPQINSAAEEAFPSITPDGKYFLFCREGELGFNPYWVDAKFIEELKPKE
jgi:hypothetical protein